MLSKQEAAPLTVAQLDRKPTSRIDKARLLLEHRAAQRRFNSALRVAPKTLEEQFPGISETRALIQNSVQTEASFGNVSSHELIVLSTTCAYLKPEVVFEFGTYDGLTTLHLAMNSPQQAQIFTIDLAPDDPIRQIVTDDTFYTGGIQIGQHFQKATEISKVNQIFGDTTKYDYSEFHNNVDFIFVDAGHAYELVKSDTQNALKMLRPGGIIWWHDFFYIHMGVYSWLNELSASTTINFVPGTSLAFHVRR